MFKPIILGPSKVLKQTHTGSGNIRSPKSTMKAGSGGAVKLQDLTGAMGATSNTFSLLNDDSDLLDGPEKENKQPAHSNSTRSSSSAAVEDSRNATKIKLNILNNKLKQLREQKRAEDAIPGSWITPKVISEIKKVQAEIASLTAKSNEQSKNITYSKQDVRSQQSLDSW